MILKKIIIGIMVFIVGLVWGYVGALVFDTYKTKPNIQVLAYETEELVLDSLSTPSPFLTPSLTPTKTPTPTIQPTFTPTPTKEPPSPTPIKVVQSPANLEGFFLEFSVMYGVDINILKRIADCESHFNPGVYSEPYAGMFQFTENTWYTYRNRLGQDPNKDLRFGARESIQTAAYALSLGHTHLWPACSK